MCLTESKVIALKIFQEVVPLLLATNLKQIFLKISSSRHLVFPALSCQRRVFSMFVFDCLFEALAAASISQEIAKFTKYPSYDARVI